MSQTLMWVVMDCDSTPQRYVIEAMDNQGVVYKTTFEGPDAERRACEYAQWKDEEARRNIAAGLQPGNYHPQCHVTGNLVGVAQEQDDSGLWDHINSLRDVDSSEVLDGLVRVIVEAGLEDEILERLRAACPAPRD